MPSNLYKRGGIWWGRLKVAGTDNRRSLRTRDRNEAARRLKNWREGLTAAVHFGENRLTWQEAVLRYATDVMPSAVKKSTADRYLVSFRQVDAHLGRLHVDQITRKALADMIAARRKDGASNATINRDLTAISAVLACCVDWEAADRNVCRDIERKRVTKEMREAIVPPEPAHVDMVVARAPGRFADLIRLLDLTGMRQEEAASLEWPQVHIKRAEITLYRTKTSRPRTIKLCPQAVALLSGMTRSLATKFVFWHGTGERYENVASRFRELVQSVVRGTKEGTEFRAFRCHDLRHGYAIRELKNGRDIYDLSRHLGHSSVKTTEKYLGYVPGGAPITRGHVLGHIYNGSPEVAASDEPVQNTKKVVN